MENIQICFAWPRYRYLQKELFVIVYKQKKRYSTLSDNCSKSSKGTIKCFNSMSTYRYSLYSDTKKSLNVPVQYSPYGVAGYQYLLNIKCELMHDWHCWTIDPSPASPSHVPVLYYTVRRTPEKWLITPPSSWYRHRVDRVLCFFSSRRNWDDPTRRRVCPTPLWFRGEGHTHLLERGWGSPNSDEGTYTVVLYIYVYRYFVDSGTWLYFLTRITDLHHTNVFPDPDPTFHYNADPDPAYKNNADPYPQPGSLQAPVTMT